MARLEVGPGYSTGRGGYVFRPHYCPGPGVVFLDVKPPSFKCSGCYWVVGDAQHLPFRAESVDEIFAGHVIEHLSSPQLFLREARRVLRGGGTVTVVTPNFLSKNARLDPDHKHVLSFPRLWAMIRGAGLKPHAPAPNVGSLLPRWARLALKLALLLLSDNLALIGEKDMRDEEQECRDEA